MRKKTKEITYYKTKTAIFPEGKCPTCVEKEMIVHRLLENLPKPNEYSKGGILSQGFYRQKDILVL